MIGRSMEARPDGDGARRRTALSHRDDLTNQCTPIEEEPVEENSRPRMRPQFGVLVLPILLILGCGTKEKPQSSAVAAADSVAFAAVGAIEDDAARFESLARFVKERPRSEQAGRAYVDLVDLAGTSDPAAVPGFLKQVLASDFASAMPYNAIGWNLAEAGEHLDLAVPILEKGVAKVRAAGDSTELAAILDSEAWARYKKGDHALAVQRMEEAYKLNGPGDDEYDKHMALIYDAAGMGEKAKPLYLGLLSHMENPALRESLHRIVTNAGGSTADIDAEISRLREAEAKDVPDFSMPSLATGEAVSLGDFRGKVVLLSFWHPT